MTDVPPAERIYPADPWIIRETAFDPAHAARNETIFALGNGHLGLRGNLEEETGNAAIGTYVNGFYDEAPILYGEVAFGYAKNHQVLLNVADGKRLQLHVGGDPFDLGAGTTEAYERSLDLRTGVLTRSVRWRAPGGTLVDVVARRLVSLARPSVAAIEFAVTLLEGPASLRLVSTINGRVRNLEVSDDPRVGAHLPEGALRTTETEAAGTWGAVYQRTRNTNLALVAAADHELGGDQAAVASVSTASLSTDDVVSLAVVATPPSGGRLVLTKYLAYCTSLDGPEEELGSRAREAIEAAREHGFEGLVEEQREELARFWQTSDVEIDGDVALQQGVRYNLFSLLQAAGRDGRTSLAAKGLTGEGYEGHYFWDTEIFALPFFVYTQPAIARSLLRFRTGTLDRARARAAEMSQKGAMYPWRTINGDEASAYFPAGTAQYHIDADIAYALRKYVTATGDRSLLLDGGAAMVFETARLWADLGARIPAHGDAFCINGVTGPDEYTALVNNNCYTNLMAQAHLRYAVTLARELAADAGAEYGRLAAGIGLTEDEVAGWQQAADLMWVPLDTSLGIHLQDDAFLDRAPWDFAGTPREMYPLLLHYHPLVIYRHQVLKQPDVVLAQVLLASRFTLAEKRRNFAFYDPLTTGDSSLSPSVQSVAAAELGHAGPAYEYFMRTARMDLDDVNGNVSHGVHIAAMAGAWFALVYGFGGFRDDDGTFAFSPRVSSAWSRFRYRLRLGDALLQVTVAGATAGYELLEGDAVEIRHFGRPLQIVAGSPVTKDLSPRLEGVALDLDGVITDTAEHHYRAWKQLATEISVPFDRELNERLKGVSRMESLEIILEHAGQTATLKDKVRLADRKNAYFRELIQGITPRDLLPGIEELLVALRARSIRTAVASMSHNVWDVVRRLGIESLVDAIVDPATLVKGKPDPEIFMAAAELLGVRCDDCVGIEDARAGVEAIKAAGMVAVGVGQDLPGADWLVPDTRPITADALEALFRPPADGA